MTSKFSRRHALSLGLGAVAAAGIAAPRACERARGGRHLGRRLRAAAREEHRGPDPQAEGLRGRAGSGGRRPAPHQDGRREAPAARHDRHPGPLRRADVRDERGGRCRDDRLFEAQERQEPDSVDEVSVRRRPHLFGQGRGLQSEAHSRRAEELQGCVRSQARQQDGHHRHPVSVRDGGGRACGRRQGGRFRARQGAAARSEEGRRAHLSDQRGVRAGAQERGDRRRHHVEGARDPVAERRDQRAVGRAERGRADVCLGLRDPEERAEQGRRLRLHGCDAGEERAGKLRDRHGLQPDRHQRDRGARPQAAHRLHQGGGVAPRRSRLRAISPRTTPP